MDTDAYPPGLTLRRASRSYGQRSLWQGLHASFLPGRMTALVGPSGSGKSTLLNCLGLLDSFDQGELLWQQSNLTRASRRGQRHTRRQVFSYLFQNFALVDNWTARRNVEVVLSGRGLPGSIRRAQADQALAKLGISARSGAPAYALSGGEQQRVALARVVAQGNPVVLVDEPTSALDGGNARLVLETLQGFAADGRVVIVASHDPVVIDAADDQLDLRP